MNRSLRASVSGAMKISMKKTKSHASNIVDDDNGHHIICVAIKHLRDNKEGSARKTPTFSL